MSAGALAVALVLGLLAPGLVAEAQPAAKPYRIGWLDPSPADFRDWRETFLAELKRRGGGLSSEYVLEWRQPDGLFDRELDAFPAFAAELVRLNVDVIVAVGSHAARATMAATRTIPIVFTGLDDPVGDGFVADLQRPGGNVTGFASTRAELTEKQL